MAKETIKTSNKTFEYTNAADIITVTGSGNKIYTVGGTDRITLSKGKKNTIDAGVGNDIITIGKKAGNTNTIKAGAGSDKITVSGGMQTIYGDAGNDTITVSGGNKHTLRGGLGSDRYIINSAIAKSSLFTINQSDYKKKDADTLKLSKVSKNDVTYGLLNGKMTIKHRSGGKIAVSGWSKNKLSKIVFKDGTLAASQYKNNIYNVKALSNAKGKTLTYMGGLKAHEEFAINFSTNTNIVINSASATADRISFSNKGGWASEHDNIYINGNDLILGNWDAKNSKELAGQITIKNFMTSSVNTIEFSDQTYHLITKSGTYTGSATYSDRFMILDGVKDGTNPDEGDWNVTLSGIRQNDLIDLRMLPVNSRFYGIRGDADGKDMVLTHYYNNYYSDGNYYQDVVLGTVRLKNFFKADGTMNTANGYPLIRINREFYAGDSESGRIKYDGLSWNRIRGVDGEPEKNYRRAYLNAGTANAETVDLGNLKKPNSKYVWMYYAGGGNDNITAHVGDIVYGGAGDDTLKATGRMSDIHGGAGNDTITVSGANGENLDRVNAYGEKGNDTIIAYGSYLYIGGGSGADEIHLYNGNNSCVTGGGDNDVIYIRGGKKHSVYGSNGDDAIVVLSGQGHSLYGGRGVDAIEIHEGVANCTAYGGAGEDTIAIHSGVTNCTAYCGDDIDTTYVYGEDNYIYGGNGDDQMTVAGGSNYLFGEAGNDTFTVGGGTNTQLYGGSGSDQYEIGCGFAAANGLHIYQNTDYGFDDGDADVLTLTGISKNNVQYEFRDNCLTIYGLEGENRVGSISVFGWDENPLARVEFSDGTMTASQINEKKFEIIQG